MLEQSLPHACDQVSEATKKLPVANLFNDAELQCLRQDLIWEMSALRISCLEGVAADQPFHLDLVRALLKATHDMDEGLPSWIERGVSTGVFDEIKPSGIWRLKRV